MWGTVPDVVLPKRLGVELAGAPAQTQDWHPERGVLQQWLMAFLLMVLRCMQMTEALWLGVLFGDCLAALQQLRHHYLAL